MNIAKPAKVVLSIIGIIVLALILFVVFSGRTEAPVIEDTGTSVENTLIQGDIQLQ